MDLRWLGRGKDKRSKTETNLLTYSTYTLIRRGKPRWRRDTQMCRCLTVLLSSLMIELARGRKARSTTMEVVAASGFDTCCAHLSACFDSSGCYTVHWTCLRLGQHDAMLHVIHALCSSFTCAEACLLVGVRLRWGRQRGAWLGKLPVASTMNLVWSTPTATSH